ncbi:hypothetical protein ABQF26_02295, partial [Mycolicibacterium elephantis]
RDVQLTYQWPDLGKLGYDKLTGVAPIVEEPEAGSNGAVGSDPRAWVDFATEILEFVLLGLGSGGGSDGEWCYEYYDSLSDAAIDLHDVFRDFVKQVADEESLPDFDVWFADAQKRGRYEEI